MPEQVQWKKCPKCEGYIPESWQRHDKCGWDSTQQTTMTGEPTGEPVTSPTARLEGKPGPKCGLCGKPVTTVNFVCLVMNAYLKLPVTVFYACADCQSRLHEERIPVKEWKW